MRRTKPRNSAAKRRQGRRASRATTLIGSFVIGVLAAGLGFTLGGTGLEQPPLSAAAQEAAALTAFNLAVSGDVIPHEVAGQPPAVVSPPPPVTRQPFSTTAINFESRGATRVVIPSVGIDADVRSVGYTFSNGSLAYDVPRRDAGQYVGTAAPGERGNSVIGGHVANRSGAAVFQALPGVKAGDVVDVYRGDTLYQYAVTEIKVVAADTTSVMDRTDDARLTLITCFPGQNFSERLVVVGQLI